MVPEKYSLILRFREVCHLRHLFFRNLAVIFFVHYRALAHFFLTIASLMVTKNGASERNAVARVMTGRSANSAK